MASFPPSRLIAQLTLPSVEGWAVCEHCAHAAAAAAAWKILPCVGIGLNVLFSFNCYFAIEMQAFDLGLNTIYKT